MLTRILATGLMAGVLAGLFVSGLQHATTVPLILKAETYEKSGAKPAHQHGQLLDGEARIILAHVEAPAAATLHEPVWEPADGVERTAYTTLATVGTAVGFSLILLAAMMASGVPVTARSAALWGLGGFMATGLAPGLGLPPELPGSAAAELMSRQAWWMATAAATAGGIWLMFQTRKVATIATGIALIAVPHVIGAPHPHAFTSPVPAEIAGHFTAASLVVHAVLWTLAGALCGYIWQRQVEPSAMAA